MRIQNERNRQFIVEAINKEIENRREQLAELLDVRDEIAQHVGPSAGNNGHSHSHTWKEIIRKVLSGATGPLTTSEITRQAMVYAGPDKSESKNPQASVSSNLSALAKSGEITREKDPDGSGYLWSRAHKNGTVAA